MTQVRHELLDANDATIDDAVRYADPMVLRGLLYQLTGDEELLDIPLTMTVVGRLPGDVPGRREGRRGPHPGQGGGLPAGAPRRRRRRAGHRPARAPAAEPEPHGRGRGATRARWSCGWRSWRSTRGPAGCAGRRAAPPAGRPTSRSLVIGAGMGGLNAAVLLKQAGIPFTVLEKNSVGRRHLVREPLPRGACRLAEPDLHPHLRRRLPASVPVLPPGREREVLQLGRRHLRACAATIRFHTEVTLDRVGRRRPAVGGHRARARRVAAPGAPTP